MSLFEALRSGISDVLRFGSILLFRTRGIALHRGSSTVRFHKATILRCTGGLKGGHLWGLALVMDSGILYSDDTQEWLLEAIIAQK